MKATTSNRVWSITALLAFGVGVIVACPEHEEDRRAEVLSAIMQTQILPDLADAGAYAQALHASVGELCTTPDAEHLDAAQQAWWDLRAPWKRLLALDLGPIMMEGFESAIDFWPARTTSIEGGVAAGVTTQAELDALGVASKGMPAIEYLLWDPVAGDQAVLDRLSAEDGPARCAYAELLAADVALRISDLDALWRAPGGFAELVETAGSNDEFPELALAIDALVNGMIAGLHDIDDPKLGKPLGLASGTGPDPEIVESRFSDRSLADARDAFEGFSAAYMGREDEPGVSVLVAQRSAEIDAQVREAIVTAEQALAAIPEPLRTSLTDDQAAVVEAQEAVRQLRILMTSDVASLLGVTVSLSDNDGD